MRDGPASAKMSATPTSGKAGRRIRVPSYPALYEAARGSNALERIERVVAGRLLRVAFGLLRLRFRLLRLGGRLGNRLARRRGRRGRILARGGPAQRRTHVRG